MSRRHIDDCPDDVLAEARAQRAYKRAALAHPHHLDPEHPEPEDFGLCAETEKETEAI